MPNKEVICEGKTIGWLDKLSKFLSKHGDDARDWECTQCGHTTRWSYEELVSSGTPQCPKCDDDMSLIAD